MKIPTTVIACALVAGTLAPETKADEPSTKPSTRTTTQSILKHLDFRTGIYLARFEHRITITSDGKLKSVRRENISYGPKDIDPKLERREIRQGQLSPKQIAEIAAISAGWDSLSDKPYTGPADGRELWIKYGEKVVSGGDAPKQVLDLKRFITDAAAKMEVVKE